MSLKLYLSSVVLQPIYESKIPQAQAYLECAEILSCLHEDISEIASLISVREPSLRLVRWQLLLDNKRIIGSSCFLNRIALAWQAHSYDQEITEHFY